MKYLMLVCTDTTPDTDPEAAPDIEAWVAERDGSGQRVLGSRLADVSAATTVRVRDGELLLTDGPFAETREVIVGFDLLECTDLDEAVEVARRHPMAHEGRLELRPLIDL
ncbi:YciI family protein [Micromonospora sp. WMMD730]|uniref:YciI family protein n=1 Tax=Micromonospora sp. WMMD730 TaxID=3404128 RepID=UPI003B93D80A